MTLAIVLEIWFKVTAHTIHKGTLYVKYKSDWAEGREDMPRISDLRFTEGQTDRLITMRRPQSEALTNKEEK